MTRWALVLLLATMGAMWPFGVSKRVLGTVATVDVPRRAALEGPNAFPDGTTWVGFRFDRFHAWAIGSGTPYRANLFLMLHAPDATDASYDDAAAFALRELNGGFDEWRDIERDDRWHIGSGRYQVNTLDEPTWRLVYRDPAQRVSVLWQVYQRDWTLAAAKDALTAMVASLRRTAEPDWAAIADAPRRAAEEVVRQREAVLAWLAARGFDPLPPEEPQTRDGIIVERMVDPEPRVMVLRRVPWPPTEPLPWGARVGQRIETPDGWEDQVEGGDYYPMPGTRRLFDRTLPPPGPHHYLIRTIRLDELDGVSHDLEEFFAFAARQPAP